MTVNFSRI